MRVTNALLVVTLFLLVAACGGDESDPANPKQNKLRFRLALELKPETKIWEVSNLFKTELEKASPDGTIQAGEIKVDFYDQGSIGTERQLLEASYFGVVEVVQVNTAVVTTIEPAYALLNLPYLFTSESHHQQILNGEIGREMLDMLLDHNLQGLGFYSAGLRSMFYKYPDSQPCAETPSDFGGLKIRVMESRTMISTINAMGASASPLPFSELYQGIKTGVVDGAENSPKVFASYRYDEAGCNCFTLTEHSTDQHVLVANADWLESLAPKYRDRILEVATAIIPPYNTIWEETTREALAQMEAANVRINTVPDKNAFKQVVAPVADQFFEMYPQVPRNLYDRIQNQAH
jgi:TRAP-type C4-dicarboxylate transport system substrate-binding protein